MSLAIQLTGDDLIRWGISAGIIAGFIVLSIIIRFVLKKVVPRLTRRTKTTLDDRIIRALTAPIIIIVIVSGLWIALIRLNELASYTNNLQKAFTIIYIAIVAVLVVRLIHAILSWYGEKMAARTKSEEDKLFPVITRFIDIVIYALGLMFIINRFNWDITPLIAGLGIGGLAVALALQPTLSNYLAGTYVITDSIVRMGHYIQIEGGIEGYIEDIGWRTTKIRHWQGNLVIMPNAKLADAIITDYDKPEAPMTFMVECGVSYDSNLEQVEQVTLEVARKVLQESDVSVKDYNPLFRFTKFGDSNVDFFVILKGQNRISKFILTNAFIKALHARFAEEGIEIQYPARKVYFANGIPEKNNE